MNDKPIAVGDLVVVVRPRGCCGNTDAIGEVYRVSRLFDRSKCACCGVFYGTFAADEGGWMRADVSRLRRIPPLSELEGQRSEETLPTKERA